MRRVQVYGTTTGTPEERRPQNVARQVWARCCRRRRRRRSLACARALSLSRPLRSCVAQVVPGRSLTLFQCRLTPAQIAVVLAVCALALTVCVALIARADLRGVKRPVALYGMGSGEESSADASAFTAFETFDGQDEYMGKALGEGTDYIDPPEDYAVQEAGAPLAAGGGKAIYYKELFEEIAESEELEEHTKEVDTAVAEAQNEHAALESFAAVGDADTTNPFLAASEQFQ